MKRESFVDFRQAKEKGYFIFEILKDKLPSIQKSLDRAREKWDNTPIRQWKGKHS